jgi:hypothetical protein
VARNRSKPRLTPARAKNLISLAKVIGPAVVPVIAPYALRAASMARDAVDKRRARRLGIAVEDLANYSGPGGALHARIAGAAQAAADLRATDAAFADTSEARLTQLAAAVRAAERMPSARRKAAHKAVSQELDRLEEDLLRRLGVN